MKISIGSDHRGFALKEELKQHLIQCGYVVADVGPEDSKSVDYPEYAKKVADAIGKGIVEKGILICGSGIGICIAANKFSGIRAATVRDEKSVRMSVLHNNANIACLGADFTSFEKAKDIINVFLSTSFEGGRHQRRIDIISSFEKEMGHEGR